jgi:hypothetical protein
MISLLYSFELFLELAVLVRLLIDWLSLSSLRSSALGSSTVLLGSPFDSSK